MEKIEKTKNSVAVYCSRSRSCRAFVVKTIERDGENRKDRKLHIIPLPLGEAR